jgi:hypothetical protein
MTADQTPPSSLHPAFEAYTETEHRIRAEYLNTVAAARRQYNIDVKPQRALYDRVERGAWHAYYQAGRAAWQAYRAALAATPEPAPPAGPQFTENPVMPKLDQFDDRQETYLAADHPTGGSR